MKVISVVMVIIDIKVMVNLKILFGYISRLEKWQMCECV